MEVQSQVKAPRLADVFAQVMRVSLSDKAVEVLSSAQVTMPQFEALRYIQSHPHSSVGSLAVGLKISSSSATNVAARLERKGYLRKKGIRANKRIVRLALTDSGDELVNSVCEARAKRLEDITQAMNNQERQELSSALAHFLSAAERCGFIETPSAVVSMNGE